MNNTNKLSTKINNISENIKIINNNNPGIGFIVLLSITIIIYIAFIFTKNKKSQDIFIIPTFIILIFFITICSMFTADFNTFHKLYIYVLPLFMTIS